jgi:hypothetical protein
MKIVCKKCNRLTRVTEEEACNNCGEKIEQSLFTPDKVANNNSLVNFAAVIIIVYGIGWAVNAVTTDMNRANRSQSAEEINELTQKASDDFKRFRGKD